MSERPLGFGWAAASVLGTALALACSSGPDAGELVAQFETGAGPLSAVSFTVRAEEPQTIDTLTAACAGCRLFTVRVSGREVRGVLTGSLGSGPAFRLRVSDVDPIGAYGGFVMEATDAAFRLVDEPVTLALER